MSHFQKEGYQIDRPEPSELFLKARHIAGARLQSEFRKYRGRVSESLDYKWVKAELTCPSFDHLTFGYGNQVFSILVDLFDSNGSHLEDIERKRFITAAEKHNLIPCLFRIMLPELKPAEAGWNLVHFVTGQNVLPGEFATDKNVPMSEWELHNFAIQVVKNYLTEKEQGHVLSFCDVLQINPQIWFEDAGGNRCWVVVRHVMRPDETDLSDWVGLEKTNAVMKDFDGFFASVSFASSAPVLHDQKGNIIPLSERYSGNAPLYRGDRFHVKFDGLQRVHVS